MAIEARFSDVEDFVAELKLDVDRVERKIVRVCPVTVPAANTAAQHVTVEASAIVMTDPPEDILRYRLVKLVTYCGELWGLATDDATRSLIVAFPLGLVALLLF